MKLDIVKDERWPDYTTTIKDYERVQKFIEELAKHQGVYK
jgi:hypothetical protein